MHNILQSIGMCLITEVADVIGVLQTPTQGIGVFLTAIGISQRSILSYSLELPSNEITFFLFWIRTHLFTIR